MRRSFTLKSLPTVSRIYFFRPTKDLYTDSLIFSLFKYEKKTGIVLYVGHTLDAVRVYDRIGFVGLSGAPRDDSTGIEDWLEIGFAETKVGHW